MAKNKYTIKYTATFINQFNNILKYFINKLQNRIAAEKFYNEVIAEIEKRSENSESFEKYKSSRKEKIHIIEFMKQELVRINSIDEIEQCGIFTVLMMVLI